MDRNQRNELALEFANIVSEAGKLIVASYKSDITVHLKSDNSPVSRADTEAEQLICARLAAIMPDVLVIAEESFAGISGGLPPERFVLVDPLDGTREFLAGRDEFTVNIALIEAGRPVVGAIYAPALDQLYFAGATAFQAQASPSATLTSLKAARMIATSPVPDSGLRAIGSRSHMDSQTEAWLRRLPVAELRTAGSSLKFCLIARGDADVYPRLAPTMEWDTAAGHAILDAAGGCVVTPDGSPLRYGKTDTGFKNNGFVAWGRQPLH
jgi:3'(2'), 5'-bisphosphate nucleotidase